MKHAEHRPRHGRVWLAILLLVLGVAAVATTAETDVWWWAVPGYLCLMCVPGLIFDAAVDEVQRRMSHESGEH